MSAEARLKELGIDLPTAPKPMGVYKPIVVTNGMGVSVRAWAAAAQRSTDHWSPWLGFGC